MNEETLERAIELTIHTRHLQKSLFESKVKTTGLYGTQHRILMHLACRYMLPSQKELADHLQITPAAVTGALKKLEADGYIEKRLGHETDLTKYRLQKREVR
jgi:DNA-binding MarR family transcriptional regulator